MKIFIEKGLPLALKGTINTAFNPDFEELCIPRFYKVEIEKLNDTECLVISRDNEQRIIYDMLKVIELSENINLPVKNVLMYVNGIGNEVTRTEKLEELNYMSIDCIDKKYKLSRRGQIFIEEYERRMLHVHK